MSIIRLVQESDTCEILDIYEPYIKDTAITFEYEVPLFNDFSTRIVDISSEYPYLVYLKDDKIVGYAYAHRQKERAAYQWNAELSVYVDKAYLRMGIGKALYTCLIEILKLQNIQNVYGGVTIPNNNSCNLHESLGFRKLGTYHHTGYKCGEWHDVAWFEKNIGSHTLAPKPFLSIKEINPTKIAEILDKCIGLINPMK